MAHRAGQEGEGPRANAAELLGQTEWVRSLARVVARDAAAADDLSQEVMAAALAGRAPSGDGLRPWLAQTVRNLARLGRRSSTHRDARERDAATSERAADHARILEEAEAHRAVVEHVMAMDERDRELLLARYFQDRSPAEIARREGRTTAAVSSQLTRAHARLRARLEASGGRERWLAGLGPLLAPTAGPAAATRIASSVLAWSWSLGAVAVSAILLGAFLALRGPGPEATAADVTVLTDEERITGDDPATDVELFDPGAGERTAGAEAAFAAPASLSARVLDAEGAPVTEGHLWIESAAGAALMDEALGDSGAATFRGLPAATPLRAYLSVEGTRWEDPIAELALASGESHETTWTVHLSTRVELRAVDRDGLPVTGQILGLTAKGTTRRRFAQRLGKHDIVQARHCGAESGVAFEGIAPGRYGAGVIDTVLSRRTIEPDGTEVIKLGPRAKDPGCPVTIPIEVPHNLEVLRVDVPVLRGHRIAGRVVDTDGNPLKHVDLCATSDVIGGSLDTTTDESGRFSFGEIVEGSYSLGSESAPDGWVLPDHVEVVSGTEDALLRMVRGGSIEVTVTGPDTDEIWIWQARVGERSTGARGSGPYDLRGGRLDVTLKGLQPGSHWIAAIDANGTRIGAAYPVHVVSSETPQPCTIDLARGLEVEIVNHDPSRSLRGRPHFGDFTAPGGYAAAGGTDVFAAPPGRSTVVLRLDGGTWEKHTVEGAAGERVTIEVGGPVAQPAASRR